MCSLLEYNLSDMSEVKDEPKIQEPLPSEPIIDAEQRLLDNCRQHGLMFHGNTPTDGNCLFHAVCDQLELLGHPPLPATQLRKFVVDFLKFNPVLTVRTISTGVRSKVILDSLKIEVLKTREYGLLKNRHLHLWSYIQGVHKVP